MNIENSKIYDYLILDIISKNSDINILAIAQKLSCAGSFVVSRLEYLCRQKYLAIQNNAFYLTDKGKEQCIPIDITFNKEECIQDKSEIFDWTIPFVPDSDIFEK